MKMGLLVVLIILVSSLVFAQQAIDFEPVQEPVDTSQPIAPVYEGVVIELNNPNPGIGEPIYLKALAPPGLHALYKHLYIEGFGYVQAKLTNDFIGQNSDYTLFSSDKDVWLAIEEGYGQDGSVASYAKSEFIPSQLGLQPGEHRVALITREGVDGRWSEPAYHYTSFTLQGTPAECAPGYLECVGNELHSCEDALIVRQACFLCKDNYCYGGIDAPPAQEKCAYVAEPNRDQCCRDTGREYFDVETNLCVGLGIVPEFVDLEIRTIRPGGEPYTFYANLCVHGDKSINDLKREIPELRGFPFSYRLYTEGVAIVRDVGASGGIEDIKNGQCNNIAFSIQPEDQEIYDASIEAFVIVDHEGLIPEVDESNNMKSFPRFSIAALTDLKDVYSEGEWAKVVIKAVEADGGPATSGEGFHIQYYAVDQSTGEQVLQGNGVFEGDYWYVSFLSPPPGKEYELTIALYCSRDDSYCAEKYGSGAQVEYKYVFGVVGEDVKECVDSDNGYVYNIAGKVIMDQAILYDACLDNVVLQERVCLSTTDYTKNTVLHECRFGCQDGACNEEEDVIVIASQKQDFDGFGSSLRSSLVIQKPFTAGAWINARNNLNRVIFDSNGRFAVNRLWLNQEGRLIFDQFSNNGGCAQAYSIQTLPSNEWVHVAYSMNENGFMNVFVNGFQSGMGQSNNPATGGQDFKVGVGASQQACMATVPQPFSGVMREVKYYPRFLTTQEIQNNWGIEI